MYFRRPVHVCVCGWGGWLCACVELSPLQLKFNWNFLAAAKSPWHCFRCVYSSEVTVLLPNLLLSAHYSLHIYATCSSNTRARVSSWWVFERNRTECAKTKTTAPDLTQIVVIIIIANTHTHTCSCKQTVSRTANNMNFSRTFRWYTQQSECMLFVP